MPVLAGLAALQEKYAQRNGAVLRTFHAKTIVGARGRLAVGSEAPAALRTGLFGELGSYSVSVRFSSGQSWEQPDWYPDIRGLAVRVDAGTRGVQDFVSVNHEVRFSRDAAEFAQLMALMQSMATVPFHIGRELTLRQAMTLGLDFAVITARTMACLSGQSFFCVAPIAFGQTAGKVSFRPRARHRRRSRPFARDGLRTSLDRWLADGELAWDVMVQPFVDERSTPLDDLSVRWDKRVAPPARVATLTLERRDAETAQALRGAVEGLAFSPWNALPAHGPVGRIQALRQEAYAASARRRGAAVPEDTGI